MVCRRPPESLEGTEEHYHEKKINAIPEAETQVAACMCITVGIISLQNV